MIKAKLEKKSRTLKKLFLKMMKKISVTPFPVILYIFPSAFSTNKNNLQFAVYIFEERNVQILRLSKS